MAKYISIHTGNKIDEAVGKVDGIEQDVSTLSQDLTTLEGAVGQLESDVNTLEGTVTQLESDINDHIGDSSIHHTISEIKTNIGIDSINGDPSHFLNELGQMTDIPLSGNGNSANVYLTTQDSEETGYKLLSYTLELTETTISATFSNSTYLVQKYLFPAGVATTVLPAGTYEFNFWASSDKQNTSIIVEFFKRSVDDVDTVLFTVESTTQITETIANIKILANQIAYTVVSTDRVGINVYFKSAFTNTTMNYIVGDGRSAYWKGTAQPRHSDTRDKNGEQSYQHIDNSVNTETTLTSNDKIAFYSNSLLKFVSITIPNFLIWIKSQLDNYFQLSNLYFSDVSASNWVSDTTYSGYGYKCDLSTTGVTNTMTAFVTFGHTEAISGNYSPVCLTGTDIITIYAKVNTSITIPRISILK